MKRLAFLLVLAAACVAACGGDDDDDSAAFDAADIDQVVRQVLSESTSETAPDQVVELSRVVVPAGESIAPHTHPGPQLAVIISGTLTYTVIEGEVEVTRDSGTEDAATVSIGSGETVQLEEGDSLVETPGMVHEAENETDEPVVIHLSSLFPEDAAPSSPAE